MNLLNHLDKNNLHHAYLIEGLREEIIPEILEFLKSINIDNNSPDFYPISADSFTVADARNLKSIGYEKSFSSNKKIFLISANNILLEAQNTLLKIFEEPIENTHFFVILPNVHTLLKTLISRFYVIKTKPELTEELKEAEKFITMSVRDRIEFIKELLTESEENEKIISRDSPRLKALKFLNAIESALVFKMPRGILDTHTSFAQIFKARQFLSEPGSSAKNLMESVALAMPEML